MASSSTSTGAVPAGQYPPLFVISPTDQRGVLVIVTALCLVTAVISLLIRAYVVLQSGTFRAHRDDLAIGITIILAIIQTSLVQQEAAVGLGRTISDNTDIQVQQIQQLVYADQIFYILCIWTSKIAAALFMYRLSPKSSDRRWSTIIMGATGVMGLVSLLLVCIVCNLAQPWHYYTKQGVTCTAPYDRWVAVLIIDIIFEVLLACLATKVIWPLQMPISRKAVACFMFYQRLIVVAPIVVRLHYLGKVYHGNDPTLFANYSTLCKEIQIAFAIVASNVPTFRPFLLATATNYGTPAAGPRGNTGMYHDTGPSIKLADLSNSSKTSRSSKRRPPADEESSTTERFSPNQRNQFATTSSSNQRKQRNGTSIDSDSSAGMIIRKDVNYNVEYYDREGNSGGRATLE